MNKDVEKIAIEHLRMVIERLKSVAKSIQVENEFIIEDFEQAVDFIEKDILELKED